LSEETDLGALNVELLDKRSVYRTPVIVLVMCAIIIAVELVALKANLGFLLGASAYALRLALPMLAVYFLSGCRCGDGPFYMTTGGFLGAVGALIGGAFGSLVQGMVIANVKLDDTMLAYMASLMPYLIFATLGSFAATYRWHSRDLEIVWGDEYGSEVGRTATEKLQARAAPPPKRTSGKKVKRISEK
jgi:hypothetical protein